LSLNKLHDKEEQIMIENRLVATTQENLRSTESFAQLAEDCHFRDLRGLLKIAVSIVSWD
jgi:hypothetical protein